MIRAFSEVRRRAVRRSTDQLRAFAVEKAGVTTVEFAFVGPMLLLAFFALMEFSILALKITTLDGAVASVSRSIYTGGAVTREGIEQEICDQLVLFSDCIQNLRVETVEMADFVNGPPDATVECVDSQNVEFQPVSNFQTGVGGSIILLRVCATTDLLLPLWGLGALLTRTAGDRYEIVSSLAFQNEPF